MMRFFRIILLFYLVILSSSFVASYSLEDISTFEDFHRNVPELNRHLQKEPLILPPLVLAVAKNEQVAVHVKTEQGHIESFAITMYENYITKILTGVHPAKLYIEIDEEIVNEIIEDPQIALKYYKKGVIQVKSPEPLKQTKLFFTKLLITWFA